MFYIDKPEPFEAIQIGSDEDFVLPKEIREKFKKGEYIIKDKAGKYFSTDKEMFESLFVAVIK